MTLYYSLVFSFLLVEMAIFGLLAAPLDAIRNQCIRVLDTRPMQQALYYAKIVCVFIFMLFLDSAFRVWRVQTQYDRISQSQAGAAIVATERSEVSARRFYAQRNMYLTGFTLFLSFVLERYVRDIRQNRDLKLEIDTLRTRTGGQQKSAEQVQELERQLKKKNADFEALERQTKNLTDQMPSFMGTRSSTEDKKG